MSGLCRVRNKHTAQTFTLTITLIIFCDITGRKRTQIHASVLKAAICSLNIEEKEEEEEAAVIRWKAEEESVSFTHQPGRWAAAKLPATRRMDSCGACLSRPALTDFSPEAFKGCFRPPSGLQRGRRARVPSSQGEATEGTCKRTLKCTRVSEACVKRLLEKTLWC